jgi:hypothetical protein
VPYSNQLFYEMRHCRPSLLQITVFFYLSHVPRLVARDTQRLITVFFYRSHVPRLVTRDTQRRETIGKLDMLRQYERCLVYAELKHEANTKMEEVKAASARLKEVRFRSFSMPTHILCMEEVFCPKISFLFFRPTYILCLENLARSWGKGPCSST